jgi:hemolysin activation/secretion protein
MESSGYLLVASKFSVAPAALLALIPSAWAQTPPTSGSTLHEIPSAPVPPKSIPEVRIEREAGPAVGAADQTKITVNALHIAGAKVFTEPELVAAADFKPGNELTLSDLRILAAKVADYYHRRGYFLAQSYVPAQEVNEGVVTIDVLEGRYGQIRLDNESRVSNSLASNLLAGLGGGEAVTIAPLEERLLLLSDLPGASVKSTLVPGASVGSSDLIVELAPGRFVSGSVDADNEGNRYTGAKRVGLTVNLNEPTGHGDAATFRAMSSGPELEYGRLAYQAQFDRGRFGIAYADMKYRLGEQFNVLQAHGSARIGSLYASYPLIRSRGASLYAVLDFDGKAFEDRQDATGSLTDKKIWVGMASINGDRHDSLLGGGVDNYSLTFTWGNLDIVSPAALAADAPVASNGHYGKLSLSAARLQTVTDKFFLYGAVNGQLPSKNLDISEKMELGGAAAVRAYPEGEAFGDRAYVATLEAREVVPGLGVSQPGQVQIVEFIDNGTVSINKSPWLVGPNRKELSAAGLGAIWSGASYTVKTYLAHKLGDAVALSAPDAKYRFWIQGIKYF